MAIHKIKPASMPALLRTPGKHADGAGLYLQVCRRGTPGEPLPASWVYQCSLKGQVRWCAIGPAVLFSLAEARDVHYEMRKLRAHGIDPIGYRKTNGHAALVPANEPAPNGAPSQTPLPATEKPTGKTFGASILAYMDEKSPAWKGGAKGATYRQWKSSLVTHGGTLAPFTLGALTPAVVADFLAPMSAKQRKRVGSMIEPVLEYMRSGIVTRALPKVKHYDSMSYAELPAFMAALAAYPNQDAARVVSFAILTCARIGEVIGDHNGKPALTWKEIEGDVWTVPAARMKKDKEHRVPLSAAARALLGDPRNPDDDVFPIRTSTPLDKLRARSGFSNFTIHGFRSSFKIWCQDNAIDDKLSEAALSHYEGGTYGAYARGDMFDRRRILMDRWAAFCGTKAATMDAV